jgi:hypothetical protein
MNSVTFKFPEELFELLTEKAVEAGEKSPHTLARAIVTDFLNREEDNCVLDGLDDLRQELSALRRGLISALYGLLTIKGAITPDQAKEFIAAAFPAGEAES